MTENTTTMVTFVNRYGNEQTVSYEDYLEIMNQAAIDTRDSLIMRQRTIRKDLTERK